MGHAEKERKTPMRRFVFLFLVLLTAASCTKTDDAPKVTISVVISPEIRGLISPIKEEFYKSEGYVQSGSKYAIELTTAMAEVAAKGVASGETRYDIWIPPSEAIRGLAQSLSRNLGAPPSDCKPLFSTPIVYAVSPEALAFLNQNTNKKLTEILGESSSQGSDDFQTAIGFLHGEPRGSVTGLSALLHLAAVQVGEIGGEEFSEENREKLLESIRSIEGFALGYGFSESTLLKRLVGGKNRFVITTEQQILLYNSDSPEPVRIVYPAEGSFNLEYAACISSGAWMTREKLEGASLFANFLHSKREKASLLGFRPTDSVPPNGGLLGNESTSGLDLKKPEKLLTKSNGALSEILIDEWRDLERPAALSLVVDHSGSMEGDRLQAVISQTRNFIANAAARDRIGLIIFSSEPQILTAPSLERESIIRRLDSIRALGGSALYDSIRLAIEQLKVKEMRPYRREIVVFTDGDDKNSSLSLSTLLALTKDATYRYGIRTTIVAVSAEDRADLSEIAEAGGTTLITASPLELPMVVEELRKSL